MPGTTATLAELVAELGGRLEPASAGALTVTGVCGIDAPRPGHVSLLIDARYRRHAPAFSGAALVVAALEPDVACAQWLHAEPQQAFDRLCERLHPDRTTLPRTIEPGAHVDPSARLAEGVGIAPGAFVGADVELGPDTRVGPGAVIEPGARLGARCRIGANAWLGPGCWLGDDVEIGVNSVIGSQGFGYAPQGRDATPRLARHPHVGGVVIEDDVHIGACCCVDAGRLEPTRIGTGSRVDNLVHLAHNVRLGARCVVLAQAGIAGSTVLEDDCALGGQAGIAGHLRLGAASRVAAQAGVSRSLPPGRSVGGSPAFELARWRRVALLERDLEARYRQLDALEQRLRKLETRLTQESGADELDPGSATGE